MVSFVLPTDDTWHQDGQNAAVFRMGFSFQPARLHCHGSIAGQTPNNPMLPHVLQSMAFFVYVLR